MVKENKVKEIKESYEENKDILTMAFFLEDAVEEISESWGRHIWNLNHENDKINDLRIMLEINDCYVLENGDIVSAECDYVKTGNQNFNGEYYYNTYKNVYSEIEKVGEIENIKNMKSVTAESIENTACEIVSEVCE